MILRLDFSRKLFIIKVLAAGFNISTIWFLFLIYDKKDAGELIMLISSISIIGLISRFGFDRDISYKKTYKVKKLIINIPISFLLFSNLFAILILYLSKEYGFIHIFNQLTVFSLIITNFIALYESALQLEKPKIIGLLCVLCGSNALLVILSLFIANFQLSFLLSQLTLFVFYYFIYRSKLFLFRISLKPFYFEITSLGLAHSFHGLLYQNYISFFIVRFSSGEDLRMILSIFRILNLSTWPLALHTFSEPIIKSIKKHLFVTEGYRNIAVFLSLICVVIAVFFVCILGEYRDLYLVATLAPGIFIFARYGINMYNPTGHKYYNFLIFLQFLILSFSLFLGTHNLLNVQVTLFIFSLYIILCCFLHHFFQE